MTARPSATKVLLWTNTMHTLRTVPVRTCLLCLISLAAIAAADNPVEIPAHKPILMPEGTRVTGTYGTVAGSGFENLLDGKDDTVCSGAPGTGTGDVLRIRFVFPKGVANVVGLTLGASDRYHNYFPHEIEVAADIGTGRFDTVLGTIQDLGPGQKTYGQYPLCKPVGVKEIELRITKYEQGKGVKRAPQISDIGLLVAR